MSCYYLTLMLNFMIPLLSPRCEKLYITLLTRGTSSLRILSDHLKWPSSSALLELHRLEKKGLVQRIVVGKRHHWKASEPRMLLEIAQETTLAIRDILPKLNSLKESNAKDENTLPEITFYKSIDGIKHVYADILNLSKGERIVTFEGVGSTRTKTKRLSKSFMIQWQQSLKKRGLILDSIISEESIKEMKKEESLRIAHLGRAVSAFLLPTETIDVNIDVVLYGDCTAFIDIYRDIAIVIKDKEIKRVMERIFTVMAIGKRKIDLEMALQSGSHLKTTP